MLLVCAALVGFALAPQQKDYSMDWSPKLGQVVEYKLSVTGKVDDEQHDGEAKLRAVVKGVTASHGYSLLCDLTGQTQKTGSEEDETSDDVKGVWMESDSEEDPDTEKFDDYQTTAGILVASFGEKRRKVGDTWKMDWGGQTQSYKFVGIESVGGKDACKVSMTMSDATSHEEDTFWLRTTDGMVLRSEEHSAGKDKDDDGKDYSYDQTYTMVMSSESSNSTDPTKEDLKLLDRVSPQLKVLAALPTAAQWTADNYNASFHEYRDLRVIVLKPKLSVDGMFNGALTKEGSVEIEVAKDGKKVSATVLGA